MTLCRRSTTRQVLLSRAESRAVDAALVGAGFPSLVLMENAGRGAARRILMLARRHDIDRAIVLVGPGNNGGDGLVVARHLMLAGLSVEVITLGDPAALRGDAAEMYRAWTAVGGTVTRAQPGHPNEPIAPSADPVMVIDALFGTGLSRPLEGLALELVRRANLRNDRSLSIALDIPSGLDADTGAPLGNEDAVFHATHTITFGTGKPGLYTGPGRRWSGKVFVVDLGAPLPAAVTDNASCWLVTGPTPLEPRAPDVHKGDNGRVLVIGGSPGMTGAALLAARGAHRAGAGLVTIASRAGNSIEARVTETMTLSLPTSPTEAVQLLEPAIARADAVVIGPGLGRDEWASAVLATTVARAKHLVIDGDALTLLAGERTLPTESTRVLTPHPLEMARLLGRPDAAAIQVDRLAAARECAKLYRSTVVLKGAGSVIATPEGWAFIVDCAEPALAVAGSGDVLAGAIAARLAERTPSWPVEEAVLQAVLAHGHAGMYLRRKRGSSRGVLASEIADQIGVILELGERKLEETSCNIPTRDAASVR